MIFQDKVLKALLSYAGNESTFYPVFRLEPILHTIPLGMEFLFHSDSLLVLFLIYLITSLLL